MKGPTMKYNFIAIPDAEIPQAVEPIFQHVVNTYASEANKTVSVCRLIGCLVVPELSKITLDSRR
jgi:hypothetical protein